MQLHRHRVHVNRRLTMQELYEEFLQPFLDPLRTTPPAFEENMPFVQQHSLGNFDQLCDHCSAVHFEGERRRDGQFTICCRAGRVILFSAPYEKWMRELITLSYPGYSANMRSYNAALSFASMGCNIVTPPGRGPYCFQVNGQVYHTMLPLAAPQPQMRRYAQIYFLDSATQATEQRMTHRANRNLNPVILKAFHQYFALYNRVAQRLKTVFERMEHERIGVTEQFRLLFNEDNVVRQQLPGVHPGRLNAPTAGNEIAAVFPMNNDEEGIPDFNREFRLHRHGEAEPYRITINVTSPHLDAYSYALFFPRGELGWNTNYTGANLQNTSRVTLLQYRAAQIQVRDDDPLRQSWWSPIVHSRDLSQQYYVDKYLGIEQNNLTWVRLNQNAVLAEEYKQLNDFVRRRAENQGREALPSIILPSSFTGSARYMRQLTQDAMTIFSRFGKPDLFITFTCNPKWPEIVDNLRYGQQPHDRPDLTSRVFNLKLKSLIEDIKDGCFGPMLCYVYTIEFQKRGLPHAHILVTLQQGHKLTTPEAIDRVVCAMLPDKVKNERLYEIVTKCMIHGPCSPNLCQSIVNGVPVCKKSFPKKAVSETRVVHNDYPAYMRVLDHTQPPTYTNRRHEPNNLYVVPYNPFLALKYNAHINVEVVSNMQSAIKYLFKYIFKGFDIASLVVTRDGQVQRDEVKDFISGRYVSSNEAVWRIFEFKTHDRSHAVVRLPIHLENPMEIEFNEDIEERPQDENRRADSKLDAFFRLNRGEDAPDTPIPDTPLLYAEVGVQYVWESGRRRWKKRQQRESSIVSRIHDIGSAFSEVFALRMLLLNIRGPTSFENIRTINTVVYRTFREAAQALNLIRNDDAFYRTFDDLATLRMPRQLRMLFAHMLISFTIVSALTFWNRYKLQMIGDFVRDARFANRDEEFLCGLALWDLEQRFLRANKSCAYYKLPNPPVLALNERPRGRYPEPNAIEPDAPAPQPDADIVLNDAQQRGFDRIMGAVRGQHQNRTFVIIGPGGSGKTTLYKEVIKSCKMANLKVSVFATTGIAATLMEGGMTAHRGFALPLDADNLSRSLMETDPHHPLRKPLQESALILIDEITMMSRHSLQIIDRILRNIMQADEPFGGKVFVVGGDFRQLLPVVPNGSRAQVLANCVISSPLWMSFERIILTDNMRARGDVGFIDWLLRVGTGQTDEVAGLDGNVIEIPQDMILQVPARDPAAVRDPDEMPPSLQAMIEQVFGNHIERLSPEELSERAILTTTLSEVMKVNNHVISTLDGPAHRYLSADTIFSNDPAAEDNYPPEFLHRLQPSGVPPHELVLKVGALVMLIRNIAPEEGLCNGTRLKITDCRENAVVAEIVSECNRGDRVFIARMEMSARTNYGFTLQRQQLPLLPSYAMTINKSQGQTLQQVGIYLNDVVFSHGQLYVALSRCRHRNNIFVHVNETGHRQGHLLQRFVGEGHRVFTRNIIYREVFVHGELRAHLANDAAAEEAELEAAAVRLIERLEADAARERELEEEAVLRIEELEAQLQARFEPEDVEPDDEQPDIEDDESFVMPEIVPPVEQPDAQEPDEPEQEPDEPEQEHLNIQPTVVPPPVCIAHAASEIGSQHVARWIVEEQLLEINPNEDGIEDGVFSYGQLFDM